MSHLGLDAAWSPAIDHTFRRSPHWQADAPSVDANDMPDDLGRLRGAEALGYPSESLWIGAIEDEDDSGWFDADWAEHFAALSETAYRRAGTARRWRIAVLAPVGVVAALSCGQVFVMVILRSVHLN